MEGLVKKPCELSIKQPPKIVLNIWENEIENNWNGKVSIVNKANIVRKLEEIPEADKDTINLGWLEVEHIFEANGWNVELDETWDNWTFTEKKKHPIPKTDLNTPPSIDCYSPISPCY